MRSRFYLLFLLATLILSCESNDVQQFEHAGGTFTMALDNEPSTYIPRKITDYYSATVVTQIAEGLVGLDPKTTEIVPKLAESWSKSDDGKTYEFTLRENVYFHPHVAFASDEERLFSADDVIKSIEMACSKDETGTAPASYAYVFQGLLKGAEDFHEGKTDKIEGLKADGNKVTIQLEHGDQNFLYKLANANAKIVSKKIIESDNETDIIGTGPFMYGEYKAGDVPKLVLVKNNEYYLKDDAGNALPYLDSLVFVFQSRKLEQLTMFEEAQTDLIVGLPTSRITRMLEGRIEDFNSKPPKLVLANNPLLESHFYFFNLNDERFKNPKVRLAFNYAINKEVIGREILRNQYYELGIYGVTPPISRAIKGYDFKSIEQAGFTYNPEKAKKLLAEAGYPNGQGFGSVELRYNINDTHSAVADEISKQIYQVLGININIDGSTFEQLNADGENGNGDIFRMGWSADYTSPETFLMNFYGKFVPEDQTEPSPINKSRYKNPIFDQFYNEATSSKKLTDQMKFFSKAEVALLEDPPLIPLWYTGDIQITYSYVRNFHFNWLNTFDFTNVYLKEWTAEEYEQQLAENKQQ